MFVVCVCLTEVLLGLCHAELDSASSFKHNDPGVGQQTLKRVQCDLFSNCDCLTEGFPGLCHAELDSASSFKHNNPGVGQHTLNQVQCDMLGLYVYFMALCF